MQPDWKFWIIFYIVYFGVNQLSLYRIREGGVGPSTRNLYPCDTRLIWVISIPRGSLYCLIIWHKTSHMFFYRNNYYHDMIENIISVIIIRRKYNYYHYILYFLFYVYVIWVCRRESVILTKRIESGILIAYFYPDYRLVKRTISTTVHIINLSLLWIIL